MDAILYRPSWQKLRVSTLKEYNPYGGMTTPDGAQDAINRFNNYLTDTNEPVAAYVKQEVLRMKITTAIEYAARIYRVVNYLHATINGLISQPGMQHLATLQGYLDKLENDINLSAIARAVDSWDWRVVKTELEETWIAERYWFMAIRADMRERVVEKDKTNNEMLTFIGLMDAINS